MSRFLYLLLIGILFVGVGSLVKAPPLEVRSDEREAPPESTAVPVWQIQEPEAYGLHAERLNRAFRRADDIERVNSLLIARYGDLIGEQYYNGLKPYEQVNVKSASKSILSALTGIAVQEGLIDGLEARLVDLLPDYFEDNEVVQKENITLEHMLTMTTGIESTSSENYGRWVTSNDWVRYALMLPLEDLPGGELIYSTGISHALGVIVARAAGTDLRTYAQQRLFDPLDIEVGHWDRDPQGNYLGGNNMWLSPRDLLRFGQLYLDNGSYNGEQIIAPEWIEVSLRGHVWHYDHEIWYGYYWWTDTFRDHVTHYAWGYGGQFIYLVPDLDLVVVTTSELVYDVNDNYEHIDRLHDLFSSYILPAVDPPS